MVRLVHARGLGRRDSTSIASSVTSTMISALLRSCSVSSRPQMSPGSGAQILKKHGEVAVAVAVQNVQRVLVVGRNRSAQNVALKTNGFCSAGWTRIFQSCRMAGLPRVRRSLAVAASAAAAPVSAAAAVSPPPPPSLLGRARDRQRAPRHVLAVQSRDGGLRFRVVGELDEAEALRAAGVPVGDDRDGVTAPCCANNSRSSFSPVL